MKTAKKIISIVLALLLTLGMVSLNGTTSVYASEENNLDTVENANLELEEEGMEEEVTEEVEEAESDMEELTEETVEKTEKEPEVFSEPSEKNDSTENVENKKEDSAETTVATEPMTVAGEISGNGWKLSEEGVFTLLADIKYVDGQPYEWEQYAEKITEVVVAEGVTEIPAIAFSSKYKNLKKVTMSSTVKGIGHSAFVNNENLTEVILNDGLEWVGVTAFSATGLTSIRLPEGVAWYSDVFTDCKNLTGTVVIPSGSKWKGNAQFYGTGVETVIIEDGVQEIPNQFLRGCKNLKYVWISKSLPQNAFGDGYWDSPIPACCIIGYKGTVAEQYVEHWLGIGSDWSKGMTFHAIDGEEHTFGEWQTVQNPTCTEKGIRKHICTICHAERTQEVDATGHTWDSGKVTLEATEKAEGVKTYTCTVCNATKAETIVKLVPSGNDNSDKGNAKEDQGSAQTNTTSPKTGDSANMFAWVLMMTTSAGAITVFYFKKRIAR